MLWRWRPQKCILRCECDMPSIRIFDSITHPTPDGSWLDGVPSCNTIPSLLGEMQRNNICGAFAVGMKGVGAYQLRDYAGWIRESSGADVLYPVAFYDPDCVEAGHARSWARTVKCLGYSGIKIHPRRARLRLDDPRLPEVMEAAAAERLVVLLCTYLHDHEHVCAGDAVTQICRLLSQAPQARVVLLHGATVRLLEMAESLRSFPNALMDLSFTLCRYRGSSVDADIAYLFRTFDQRLCIGSDSPEYSQQAMRERFEQFSDGLPREGIENIAFRNIMRFADLDGADAALTE
jgi:predicted TIM-barrel fold metal-dependent hydrolase